MKGLLALAAVLILGMGVLMNARPPRSPQLELARAAEAAGGNPAVILRATVRIIIAAPYMDAHGRRVFVHENGRRTALDAMNRGLGTLVVVDGHTYIVTHDHYGLIDTAVADATITDYAGREYKYPIADFRRLVRYRNNSVILLDAPAGLPAGAPPGDGELVGPGSVVNIVHRDPDTDALSVVSAVVEEWIDFQGIPSFRLRNVNGEIVFKGNSGGGVWAEGRPVGSIHRTIMATETAGGGAPLAEPTPSHRSYATRLSPARVGLLE